MSEGMSICLVSGRIFGLSLVPGSPLQNYTRRSCSPVVEAVLAVFKQAIIEGLRLCGRQLALLLGAQR